MSSKHQQSTSCTSNSLPREWLVDLKSLLDEEAICRVMQIFDVEKHNTKSWFKCPECSRFKLRADEKNPINLTCSGCSIKTNLFSISALRNVNNVDDTKSFTLKKIIKAIKSADDFHVLATKFDYMLFKYNLTFEPNTFGHYFYIGNYFDEYCFMASPAIRNVTMQPSITQMPYIVNIENNIGTKHAFVWSTSNRILEI